MTAYTTSVRPIRIALLAALATLVGTGVFSILSAQPEAPVDDTGAAAIVDGTDGVDPTAQPIAFSHEHHVSEIGIDCQFCHAYARRGPVAGIPPVQTCAGCHEVVLNEAPEILKVLEYWENEQPIPWVRVHDLPDYVRFSHKPHIRAGVDCASCHGDVASMEAAVQTESLSMGWCVTCHDERDASKDCLVCHY